MLSVVGLLLIVPGAAFEVAKDSPVTKVVKLLQEMLENSKEDGSNDREAYAKFKCYCDTNTAEKTHDILNATGEIERMDSTIAKARATNAKLSSEIFELTNAMDDNTDARDEARANRQKARAQFLSDESDMETGIDQLDRAIKLLAAVGADQSEPNEMTNADNTAAMQGQGALAMKFLQKEDFSTDAKQALRAASVFLTSAQRKAVTSFLQAPGNYNAQSGEITGILKNMNDTFTANLATARDEEAKSVASYQDYMETATTEFNEMKTSRLSKKDQVADESYTVASTSAERKQLDKQKTRNEEFLAKLTERCATKKAEFDKRNMLRSNEEAAIAQAIAILNSDDAFEVFSNTDVSQGVGGLNRDVFFLQTSSVIHRKSSLAAERAVRAKVIKSLLATAKETHSLRLARTIASLAATNPFEAVVKQIRGVIDLIDKEKEADQNKKDWCDAEQSEKNGNAGDQQSDIGTLNTNIANLQTAVDESNSNIEQAQTDMVSNQAAQASETSARKEAHTNFQANLKNLQDAQTILGKAIEVLTKYYDFLHKSTADHSYVRNSGKDSGGSNLEQIGGNPSVADLEEACSARPDCAGFNTAGWLKSAIADSAEWYDWDGGDLYVKDFDFFFLQEGATQQGPSKGPKLSKGGEGGDRAIRMLTYIKSETKDEADTAMDNEKTSQMQYETNMKALSTSEDGLSDNIASYKVDLATSAKRLEQAKEDKAATQAELDSTRSYLAEIEPGCTYIQSNIGARQAAQASEKTALLGAINTLESSPAYTNYAAAQESEDLGFCSAPCSGSRQTMTAQCQACINDVTIFGYCAQDRPGVSGCTDINAIGSVAAMNLEHPGCNECCAAPACDTCWHGEGEDARCEGAMTFHLNECGGCVDLGGKKFF